MRTESALYRIADVGCRTIERRSVATLHQQDELRSGFHHAQWRRVLDRKRGVGHYPAQVQRGYRPYHQKWIERRSRFGSIEFDLGRESQRGNAAADAGTERNQRGARASLKLPESGTHAERPCSRMLDHVDILRTGERGQRLDFIEREVAILAALAAA